MPAIVIFQVHSTFFHGSLKNTAHSIMHVIEYRSYFFHFKRINIEHAVYKRILAQFEIDIQERPTGIYVVRVLTEKASLIRKIVKN